MKIRQDQIGEFASARESEFVLRMVRHLKEDLPADCARQGLKQDRQLEAFVREQMENARLYGFESGRDLKTYLECAAVYGPAFDRDPELRWATTVLQRSDLTGDAKADVLHDHLIFRG